MHRKDITHSGLDNGAEPAAFPMLLIPLDPAFRAIGVRRTKGYELIALGHLTMVKIGGKSLITTDSLRSFAASLPPVPTPVKG
ncbi:MAG: hypothetical protein JWQ72_527 [Polaromonas sp.]|nr:hypothetical protein [Polaromonas sp.]